VETVVQMQANSDDASALKSALGHLKVASASVAVLWCLLRIGFRVFFCHFAICHSLVHYCRIIICAQYFYFDPVLYYANTSNKRIETTL